MSGGFSFGQCTTAFNFGGQKPAAAATPNTGFGMPGSTPAAAGGGFSFGSAAPTAPGTNPTGSFSFGTPAKSTAAVGGLAFGTPASTTATFGLGTPAQTSAQGGFTLSGALTGQTPAAVPAAATTTIINPNAGFAFGIKPSSTPAPAASTLAAPTTAPALFASPITTAAAPAIAPGFALGVAPTTAATITPATTAAAGGGSSFVLKPLGPVLSTTSSTPAPAATTAAASTGVATGFALALKPTPSTISTASGTSAAAILPTTSITTTAAAAPVMTYAQLESLMNKWSLELEDQERHFLQQATQVNAWDRMLVENGEKITSLHKEMEKVKLDQRRLNQELDFILSQQKELEDLLCPLEESVKEQSGTIYMQNADEERERTYKLAENVDAQLKRMSQDLKEIIEHLNTSSGPADTSDPLQQICKILNAHMDSLQWIDQNSVLLQRRVEEVSKICDTQRKEQEKTFRLTFD
uniref:Nuclear pore glycoprotein p62 n=1 Tax=Gouania willdenowi TaxID=441366 RepID=A0A8C5GQP4_GOUWI